MGDPRSLPLNRIPDNAATPMTVVIDWKGAIGEQASARSGGF